jgi:transcriptional regulator with XRE-family HTH domain
LPEPLRIEGTALPQNRPGSAKAPSSIDALVGSNIRIHRILKGITQTQLAERLGITFQQLQKYERGVNRVGSGRLAEIARVLEISITDLYEGMDAQSQGRGSSLLRLVADREPLRLVEAFALIPDRKFRRALVDLVDSMAQRHRATRRT